MISKFEIWQGKSSLLWFIFTPDARLFTEESFRDAVIRMNLCILESENV